MTMTATTVKMFIDIFIGIWAFILAIIWCAKIECKPGQKASAIEIWYRFPKFVIGYALTFFILLVICWPASTTISPVDKEIKAVKTEITATEKQLASTTAAQTALQEKINAAKDKMKTLTAQKSRRRTTPAGKELKALKLEIAESEKQLAATTKASQATQADLRQRSMQRRTRQKA